MDMDNKEDKTVGLNRRDLLKRGAIVGVAAAWTIPLVQVVAMTPAHAEATSGGGTTSSGGTTSGGGRTIVATSGPIGESATSSTPTTATTATSDLASTGPAVSVTTGATAGAAALALGAGTLAAAQIMKKRMDAAEAE